MKLHRTGERFIAMCDATRADFAANIEVLDWQQKQQKNKDVGELENVGFKDFLTVKDAYIKERARKKAAAARIALVGEPLQPVGATSIHISK